MSETIDLILEFVAAYAFPLLVLLIMIIYLIVKVIKRRSKKKEEVKISSVKEEAKQNIPEQESEKPVNDDFMNTFKFETELVKEQKRFDISEEMVNLNNLIRQDIEDVDKSVISEFDNLRKQLIETNNKKEAVKRYGLELAKLYDKYRKREIYLTAVMSGLDEIMAKEKVDTKLQSPR